MLRDSGSAFGWGNPRISPCKAGVHNYYHYWEIVNMMAARMAQNEGA